MTSPFIETPKPSPEALSLKHFYFGNIHGRGQVIVGASEMAAEVLDKWVHYAETHLTLGNLSRYIRWQNLDTFYGTAVFDLGKAGAVVALLQKPQQGDNRSPFLYHWILLTFEDKLALQGNWQRITRPLRQQDINIASSFPDDKVALIDPVSIKVNETISDEAVELLYTEFNTSDSRVLRFLDKLLSTCFAEEIERVAVLGLPENETRREDYAMAVAGILPPTLRAYITYATRVVGEGNKRIHLNFISDPIELDIPCLFDTTTTRFSAEANVPTYPLVERLLQEAQRGKEALIAFHNEWSGRSYRLMQTLKSAPEAASQLLEWIEVEDHWEGSSSTTISRLIHLLANDSSLTSHERTSWFSRLVIALLQNYPTPPEEGFNEQIWHTNEVCQQIKQYDYLTPQIREILDRFAASQSAATTFAWLSNWYVNDPIFQTPDWQRFIQNIALNANQYICENESSRISSVILSWLISAPSELNLNWLALLEQQIINLSQEQVAQATQQQALEVFQQLLKFVSASDITSLSEDHFLWLQHLPFELKASTQTETEPGYVDFPAQILNNEPSLVKLGLVLIKYKAVHILNQQPIVDRMIRCSELALTTGEAKSFEIAQITTPSEISMGANTILEFLGTHAANHDTKTQHQLFVWSLKNHQHNQRCVGLIDTLLEHISDFALLAQFVELHEQSNDQILPSFCHAALNQTQDVETQMQRLLIILETFADHSWYVISSPVFWFIERLASRQFNSIDNLIIQSKINANLVEWQVRNGDDAITQDLFAWWFYIFEQYATTSPPQIEAAMRWLAILKPVALTSRTSLVIYRQMLQQQLLTLPPQFLRDFLEAIQTQPHFEQEQSFIETIFYFRQLIPEASIRLFSQNIQMMHRFFSNLHTFHTQDVDIEFLEYLIQEMAIAEQIHPQEIVNLARHIQAISIILLDLAKEFENVEKSARQKIVGGQRTANLNITSALIEGNRSPKSLLGLWNWISGVIDKSYHPRS